MTATEHRALLLALIELLPPANEDFMFFATLPPANEPVVHPPPTDAP